MKVRCDQRYEHHGGQTCRQARRTTFEFWCDPCVLRWDHDRGRHAGNPEPDCSKCVKDGGKPS